MAVLIGHASVSENGTIYGDKGDQTKKEVCVRNWYNGSWDFVAIHPDETVREKHAKALEAACANDNVGYDQGGRNSLNTEAKEVGYDIAKIKTKCECDCSSLQNVCAVASGAKDVTYASNGWTTRNMRNKLKEVGYIIFEDKNYLKSADYCIRGGVYVREGAHTVGGLTNGDKYEDLLEKVGLSKPKEEPTTEEKKHVKATGVARSKDTSLAGKYVVTAASLNVRNGAGTSNSVMVIIPKGTVVRNYGFYTQVGTTKWLLVQFTYKNVVYTGFCSTKYLKKS